MIAIKKDAMRYRDPETGKFVGVSLIGGDAPSGSGGGTPVEIDGTLTQSGKAADAKAVGDQLSALNEANAAQDERLTALEGATVPDGDDLNLFYGALIRRKANQNEPLDIKTFEAGQDQPTHPSVLFFPSGWNGHKYWMAYTPYPNNNASAENPCITYSDDGIAWSEDGISNPIEPTPSAGYNSDVDIVMVGDTMECWWRWVDGSNREVIKRRKSADGINWTNAETLFQTDSTDASSCLSPAAIYEDGVYKIWVVYHREYVMYYESADGTNWQHIRNITGLSPLGGYKVWHIDVTKTMRGYEFVGSYQLNGQFDQNNYIAWSVSSDNITYSAPICVLGNGNSGNFDDLELYRPSLTQIGRKYRMYYGAQKDRKIWHIGVVETPQMELLNELLAHNVSDLPTYEPPAQEIPCTGITLDKNVMTFTETVTQTLIATVTPSDTTDTVVWATDDDTVATVSGGVVTAVGNGNATITATCGKYSATCTVSVSIEVVEKVTWETSGWNKGYYNDTGEFIENESGLTMYHSDMIPTKKTTYGISMSGGQNYYMRFAFYDANMGYIGYDFGSGLNATSGNRNRSSISTDAPATNDGIAYMVVCANTPDKSKVLLVESTSSVEAGLLAGATLVFKKYINSITGAYESNNGSNTWAVPDYIAVDSGGAYVLSTSEITPNLRCNMAFYDADKTFVKSATDNEFPYVFTVPDGCHYLRFHVGISSGTLTTDISKFGLNKYT